MAAAIAPARPRLYRGDIVTDTVSKTRWIVKAFDSQTGAIELESSNAFNSSSTWSTTVDALPETVVWS